MNIVSVLMTSLAPVVMLLLPLFLMVLAFKLYSPKIIGWIGERRIRSVLDGLDSSKYTCFHDVLLPIGADTTQIDHIVFVGDKCFVIETKAHAGWIFGSAHDEKWTQTFNKRSKFKFQNPLRQNYKHILAVRNIIGTLSIESVVVFTRGVFKSERIENVLYPNELKSLLLKYSKASCDNKSVMKVLKKAIINEKGAHKEHVRKLQSKYGGRWRIPLANTLLLCSLVLLIFKVDILSLVTTPSTPISSQVKPSNGVVQRMNQASLKLLNESQKKKTMLPRLSGSTKGMVILSKDNDYKVLKVGGVTSDGWELLTADTQEATFLHKSGEKASIRTR